MTRAPCGWGAGQVVSSSLLAALRIAPWPRQAPEHRGHGTPEVWKIAWFAGNPAAGRGVFATIQPNALGEEAKGYRAADGKSKMPSYNDLVTVQKVIDLVAFLKGLKGTGPAQSGQPTPPGGHMMPGGQMPKH